MLTLVGDWRVERLQQVGYMQPTQQSSSSDSIKQTARPIYAKRWRWRKNHSRTQSGGEGGGRSPPSSPPPEMTLKYL